MLDCSLRNQTCSILDSIQHCCRHRVIPRHRYSSLSYIALLGSRHQSFIRREAQHQCRASSSSSPVNVRGRRKAEGNEELPSWIAWDQEALKQQAASLIELQVDRTQQDVHERRRGKRTARKSFQPTYEAAVNPEAFEALKTEDGIDYAAFCNGNMQWFAVKVADADIKKAGFVTKWLGYGGQTLGPVKKKDGTTVDRVIETWLPKKKVKAYSLRTGKMGTRTVAYQDGQVVLFRAIMDNELGEYLKGGLPDTSGVYNDRVMRNEGRITGFVDEEVGSRLFLQTKTKRMVEKEHIPKPCTDEYIDGVKQWLEIKETWEKEKVYMVELGYVPDEATGWSEEGGVEAEEELEKKSRKTPGRKSKQLDPAIRDFAEAILEKEKREVAALDSAGWNVGTVVEPRSSFRGGYSRGRGRGVGTQRAPGRPLTRFRPETPYQGDSRQSWSTAEPEWDSDAQYSSGAGPSSEWAKGLNDFASLEDFSTAPTPNPTPDSAEDGSDSAWAASGYHMSTKPEIFEGAGESSWAHTEEAAGKADFVEALGNEDLSPAHPEDWEAPDTKPGWTSGLEETGAAPKGWSTATSGDWVDDSATAAGSFFERAPRSHTQAGRSGWAESSPAVDTRGTEGGPDRLDAQGTPEAPRLWHWSKYGTADEPVRGDPSVRGRRRNREMAGRSDGGVEPGTSPDALTGAGGSEVGESADGVWSESVPSPTFEWDSEPLPTTSNWEEWNSYIAPDSDFPAGDGIPFRVDDDDLFVGISDEETVENEGANTMSAAISNKRPEKRESAKGTRGQRKKKGGDSGDERSADLFGDSVEITAADELVEDTLAWDEMA